ncbi:MAG: AraC family transcriptional regulator [Clostridiales bacterium]|nr:AraC family transcriptional regulator [Clostridiales bacterium]
MKPLNPGQNLKVQVLVAGYTHVGTGWKYHMHRPSYNRLYYIRSGHGFVEINGVRYLPGQGQLLLVPAGARVSFGTLPGKDTFTKYWMHFDARLGDTPLFDLISVPWLMQVEDPAFVLAHFQTILDGEKNKEDFPSVLRQQAAVMEFIAWILDQHPVDRAYGVGTGKLDAILAFIHENIGEEISVGMLSQMIGLHPNHFIKVFHMQMGTSPGQYINKLRLEQAKELLLQEDLTIREVASLVGFRDESYFSRAFKKYIGRTPREYRRESLCTHLMEH